MNKREAEVYDKLIKEGYEVYHAGFPDFLAYNPGTNKIVFIEVKGESQKESKRGGLTECQQRVLQILSMFHPVRLEYVSKGKKDHVIKGERISLIPRGDFIKE